MYLKIIENALNVNKNYILKTCIQCRVKFLTFSSNRLQSIRCPFGCRENHRRSEAIKRSIAYYQTKEGKAKKRELNKKRKLKSKNHLPNKSLIENKEIQKNIFIPEKRKQGNIELYIILIYKLFFQTITINEATNKIIDAIISLRQHTIDYFLNRYINDKYD